MTNEELHAEVESQRAYLISCTASDGRLYVTHEFEENVTWAYDPTKLSTGRVLQLYNFVIASKNNGGEYNVTQEIMDTAIQAGSLSPVYRGGANLEVRSNDVKVDKSTGMVQPGRGVSVNVDPAKVEKFGGAFKVESVPSELEVIQRGMDPNHFEIAPRQAMTLERFQELLKQVKLVPAPK